jgi:hypothetical protein
MTSESPAFGRGGLGAVMGAKRVKAITFDGASGPMVELPAVAGDVHREAANSDHMMKEQGTTSVTELANGVDALPYDLPVFDASLDAYHRLRGWSSTGITRAGDDIVADCTPRHRNDCMPR